MQIFFANFAKFLQYFCKNLQFVQIYLCFCNFCKFHFVHCNSLQKGFCKSLRSLQNKRNQLRWFLERPWPCTRPEREWVVQGLYMIKVCHRSCEAANVKVGLWHTYYPKIRGDNNKTIKEKIQKGDNYNTVVAT